MRRVGGAILAIGALGLIALMGLYFVSWAGTKTTHLRCDGTLKLTVDKNIQSFGKTRVGLKVQKFSWFVFWASEKKKVNYTLVAFNPDGSDFRTFEIGLPLWELNETFFSTDISHSTETQVYYDNQTNYVTVFDKEDTRTIDYVGLCIPVEPAF